LADQLGAVPRLGGSCLLAAVGFLLLCESRLRPRLLRLRQLHLLASLLREELGLAGGACLLLVFDHGVGCTRTSDGPKAAKDVVSPAEVRYSCRHGRPL
jgi:hypothetical protein